MTTPLFLHGFGARYDLPIPLSIYLYAAGAVVLVSFVLVVLFAAPRGGETAANFPRHAAPWLAAATNSPVLRVVAGAFGVVCLAVTIVTGLLGSANPLQNPSAYLVWIYLWVGVVLISALLGNLWTLINPFDAIYSVLARVFALRPRFATLPGWLGIWPATVIFFGIAWLELASGVASTPVVVGSAALAYTVLTVAGMVVFGRRDWLDRCEAFTVLFGISSRFAPTEIERDETGRATAGWLRPWGTGLLLPVEAGWDRILFVVLMLSNLAFDGIESTPLWFNIASSQPPVAVALGTLWRPVIYTAGLLAVALIFVAAFTLVMQLVMVLGRVRVSWIAAMTAFAYTLVPIALVYDAAHNYTYLTVVGQDGLPAFADPLGRGWRLLPVQGFQPSLALAAPATVWLAAVVLIVVGHVVAVYLAHRRAMHSFRTAQNALTSQYPMLVLMVLYTLTSLWILAQPTTNAG